MTEQKPILMPLVREKETEKELKERLDQAIEKARKHNDKMPGEFGTPKAKEILGLLTDEKLLSLINETGWSIKRAESLNLISNYRTVAKAQLAKADAECRATLARIKKEIEKLGATTSGLIIIDPDKHGWQEFWKEKGVLNQF